MVVEQFLLRDANKAMPTLPPMQIRGPPSPPRDRNQQGTRCCVDCLIISTGAVPNSADSHDMAMLYQKQYCWCHEDEARFVRKG